MGYSKKQQEKGRRIEAVIKKALKGNPSRRAELEDNPEIKNEIGSSLKYWLNKLAENGEIMCLPPKEEKVKKVRYRLYFLPEDQILAYKRYEKDIGMAYKMTAESYSISPEIRHTHTKDIQKKVIKPWLENIPVVCWDGVYMLRADMLKSVMDVRGSNNNKKLEDKSEYYTFVDYYYPKNKDKKQHDNNLLKKVDKNLYDDLKENHINEKIGNPFQLWDKFNSLSCEYWDKICQFIHNVVDEFLISKVGVSREDTPKDCYDFLILDVLLSLWEHAPFVKDIPRQEYNRSHKTLKCGIYYSRGRYHFMATVKCKKYFEEFHPKIVENVSAVFEENEEQIKQIIKLMGQIEGTRKQLVNLLNAYSDVKILPGTCHYLGDL